ncbi:MAG: RidA family protein [Flavobacteriaceae bacterium]
MKTIINTKNAPAPIGPYNQAIKSGDTLFISGQIGFEPSTMEWVSESIAAETEQVMKNLAAVLEAANMDFEHVVKSTIFLDDMAHFAIVNEVYGRYFDDALAPARETVAVRTLPKNVRVEISMIAIQ